MKKLLLGCLLAGLVMLAGCASRVPANLIALTAFPDEESYVVDIPSHGYVSDGLAIAVGGGAGNVNSLRQTFYELVALGGKQNIVVASTNRKLASTVLLSALDDFSAGSLEGIHVAIVSSSSDEEKLRNQVEATGAKLNVIVR